MQKHSPLFRADLHLHSRFSRATSKKLDLDNLAYWAKLKGIQVLGTGDFTHPLWLEHLQAKLEPASNQGLFMLNTPDSPLDPPVPAKAKSPLFMLQGEISCIYKKQNQVRKVHNLVYMPNFKCAEQLNQRLATIGNLQADGRPMLKLDSEDLLAMVLDLGGVLIPAHVWTPWFAIFGSKSGFDLLTDCFGSLSSEIFALETGLSANPPMFRMCSQLDNYALISNSDAHSGENLGREVNIFRGYPSFNNIFAALKASSRGEVNLDMAEIPTESAPAKLATATNISTPTKLAPRKTTPAPKIQTQTKLNCQFLGTVEFFPQEGKYYYDGHAACNISCSPKVSQEQGNLCPVCHKPLTLGVLHRIQSLADRSFPKIMAHENFVSLIPLPEVLGQLLSVGYKSLKVQRKYQELLQIFGSELDILQYAPLSALQQHWPELSQALAAMRRGEVHCTPGYDGIYGQVKIVI